MKLRDELTQVLIKAAERRPWRSYYKGCLTEEEFKEIEKRGFELNAMSIYMDGPAVYEVKYTKGE